jgi:hypothetical protein
MRQRYPEPRTAISQRLQFLRDLVGNIPWQDHHVIGLDCNQNVWCNNGNMTAGQELALFR